MIAVALLLLLAPVKVPSLLDLQNGKDPVSGKKAGTIHADWKGVRVHFESEKSRAAFAKDPAKYLGKLGLRWDKKAKVLSLDNQKCPVTKKAVDRKHYADKNGLRLFGCCAKCSGKLWADPQKRAKALGYRWIPELLDLKNETCPVTGDRCYEEAPIWVDLQGFRIRVCCDRCVEKAKENPERTLRLAGVAPKKPKEVEKK